MDPIVFLAACVRETTGRDDLPPREGQQALTSAIADAFEGRTRMIGEAPTGSGKGLSYLSVAALRWAEHGERTVVSTESIALQTQLVTKDLPSVAAACEDVLGVTLPFALLKGRSNYVDPLRLMATLAGFGGDDADQDDAGAQAAQARANLETIGSDTWPGSPKDGDRAEIVALLTWAMAELESGGPGDRASCPVPLTERLWSLVAAPTSEGTTADDEVPWVAPVLRARNAAAQAAIVVTNHAMLGVQAAKGVPVLLSNVNLGAFQNIAIDEGHTLPQKVRDQGASELTTWTPKRLIGGLRGLYNDWDDEMQGLLRLASTAEDEIRRGLDRFLRDPARPRKDQGRTRTITEREPLPSDVFSTLEQMASMASSMVGRVRPRASNPRQMAAYRKATARVESVLDALEHVREPIPGFAVWAEPSEHGAAAKVSPVEVQSSIAKHLWTTSLGRDDDEPGDSGRFDLGVALVSATLPQDFGPEIAIDEANRLDVESPFEAAFAGSAYFVPQADADDARALAPRDWRTKEPLLGKLDTNAHPAWCAPRIVELVRANGGSALVLGATTAGAREYARALRAGLPDVTVHDQWSTAAVASWRADERSVLVGTRSLMTGVDAPGETCSLVVIDRVPRSAPNPVDDARVRLVQRQRGIRSEWDAMRYVYVSDAALLLQQATGRLIRHESDRGAVALLDPRMHRGGAMRPMHVEDWKRYRLPTIGFGTSLDDLDAMVSWLETRRSSLLEVG